MKTNLDSLLSPANVKVVSETETEIVFTHPLLLEVITIDKTKSIRKYISLRTDKRNRVPSHMAPDQKYADRKIREFAAYILGIE